MRAYRTSRLKKNVRRGFLTPLIAVVLVIALGCIALVVDRLWIHTVVGELTTTAESSAIAAAGELADDDLLRGGVDWDSRLDRCRLKAAEVAGMNRVAGEEHDLDISEEGDVKFGRLVWEPETGRRVFTETNVAPLSVRVSTERSRGRKNPVGLFVGGLFGQPVADAAAFAEATIENRIIGVRAQENIPVPALPFAILGSGIGSDGVDSWGDIIEAKRGQDLFGFDARSKSIYNGSDGLPEIVVRTKDPNGDANSCNLVVVNFSSGFQQHNLMVQTALGLSPIDLDDTDGELRFHGDTIPVEVTAEVHDHVLTELMGQLGRCRILPLYENYESDRRSGYGRAELVGLVAGRVMQVRRLPNGVCELVIQPCVMTTRTAIIDPEVDDPNHECTPNRYIYKLQLTR